MLNNIDTNSIKNGFRLLSMVVLLIGLVAGLVVVRQRQDLRKRAQVEEPTILRFEPELLDLSQGEVATLSIYLQTEYKITATQIQIEADPDYIEIISTAPDLTSSLSKELIPTQVTNNIASFVLGTDAGSSATGIVQIAEISIQAISDQGTTNIIFNQQFTVASALGFGSENVLTNAEPAVITFVSPVTPTPTPPTSTPTPTVCPQPEVPSNPDPVGTTSCGLTSLTFSWDPVLGSNEYGLRIDEDPDSWSGSCETVNPGDTCINDLSGTEFTRNVIPGKTYRWWVHAISSCYMGWGPPVDVSVTVPACPTPTSIPTNTPTPIPVSGATIILNSATNLNCNRVCSNQGLVCTSVGLDSQASDTRVEIYQPNRSTCVTIPGGQSCNSGMRDRGEICNGNQANWTYCRCE